MDVGRERFQVAHTFLILVAFSGPLGWDVLAPCCKWGTPGQGASGMPKDKLHGRCIQWKWSCQGQGTCSSKGRPNTCKKSCALCRQRTHKCRAAVHLRVHTHHPAPRTCA
eukprot:1158165-Pelagomonas_calceolata.AAC.1